MKKNLRLLLVASAVFFAACIQEFPVTQSPCPCAEGYRCCTHVTGENVCVGEDKPCPCEEVVCIDSPPPECLDGQALRYFRTPGNCHLGKCSYDPSDVTCAYGCQNNACVSEPCAGEMSWVTQAGGLGITEGSDVEVLPDGSSIVVGTYDYSATFGLDEPNQTTLSKTPGEGQHLFMARYSPEGALDWVVEVTGRDTNSVSSVAGREDGSFYVTGRFGSMITFGPGEPNETILSRFNCWDAYVALYNPDGTLAWAKRIAGHEDGGRGGASVATLADGSAVVTGFFFYDAIFAYLEPNQTTLESITSHDVFVAKYNPDGSLAWARQAGGNFDDRGTAVAASPDGSILVAGTFGGDSGGSATFGNGEPNETTLQSEGWEDIFIAKYNPDGLLEWAKRDGGANREGPGDISVFPDGSFLIAGEAEGDHFGPGPGSIFVAMYNPDGEFIWSKRIGGERHNYLGHMSTIQDGSFLLSGSFQESATFGPGEPYETTLSVAQDEYGYFVARYNYYGSLEWVLQNGGMAKGVAALRDGTALATGDFMGTSKFSQDTEYERVLSAFGQSDLFVMRLSCPCVVDPKSVPILGRLWVMPNPIRYGIFPGHEYGPTWVDIVTVGSEDVVIDSIYLVGAPDFRFPTRQRDFQLSDKVPDFPFPLRIEMDEHDFGGGIMGFEIDYWPTTTRNPEAFLVVKTSDPTSPTLRIPFVPAGGYPWFDHMGQEACLAVKPNPIRLDPLPFGNSQTVEIGVQGITMNSDARLRNVAFSTIGEDFSITEITDNLGNKRTPPFDMEPHADTVHISLEYRPRDDQPNNGFLVLTFMDRWGLTQTLQVPILVDQTTPDTHSVYLFFEDDFLDLETGRIEESTIPHNPDFPEWDVKVAYGAVRSVHSVIIQNQERGTEIAHLEGYSFESVTLSDVSNAVFTNDLMDVPFDNNRVILINTASGMTYKLGNPIEGQFGLKFNYAALW